MHWLSYIFFTLFAFCMLQFDFVFGLKWVFYWLHNMILSASSRIFRIILATFTNAMDRRNPFFSNACAMFIAFILNFNLFFPMSHPTITTTRYLRSRFFLPNRMSVDPAASFTIKCTVHMFSFEVAIWTVCHVCVGTYWFLWWIRMNNILIN